MDAGWTNFLTNEPDLNGKVIFISGGTGSFGNEFVKKIIGRYQPKKLIIFSRDELKQFEMAQVFPEADYPFIRYFIGDIRDHRRLDSALRGVDFVIHAAAMKHVHIAEYNPYECIHTNILGAENLVRAALKNKVKKVLALSTDKAASPINLYGATKLAAEKTFIAANNIRGDDPTIFSVVRYGNVIGSRGSIVPFFKKMMAKRAASLPITDKRMTRFWMTLPQSVDFVLSNLEMMQGGEIFIPKLPSMRITDMLAAIAPNYPTHEIGIRPGEKLHECMITSDESANLAELKNRFVIMSPIIQDWQYKETGVTKRQDRFAYTSDMNDSWLSAELLLSLINE